MYLKILALLTILIFLFLIFLGFIFNIPIAYVPQDASSLEFVLYHVIFMIVETFTLMGLFLHMLIKADLDIDIESLRSVFLDRK